MQLVSLKNFSWSRKVKLNYQPLFFYEVIGHEASPYISFLRNFHNKKCDGTFRKPKDWRSYTRLSRSRNIREITQDFQEGQKMRKVTRDFQDTWKKNSQG